MVTSILLCLSPHTADFAPNPKPLAQGWKMMKAWHWEIVSWIVSWHCATLRHCVTWSRPCSFHPPPQDSGLGHPPSWLWCCQPNVENRGNQLISINITQHQSTCRSVKVQRIKTYNWTWTGTQREPNCRWVWQTLLWSPLRGLMYSTQTGTNPLRTRHAQGMMRHSWARPCSQFQRTRSQAAWHPLLEAPVKPGDDKVVTIPLLRIPRLHTATLASYLCQSGPPSPFVQHKCGNWKGSGNARPRRHK